MDCQQPHQAIHNTSNFSSRAFDTSSRLLKHCIALCRDMEKQTCICVFRYKTLLKMNLVTLGHIILQFIICNVYHGLKVVSVIREKGNNGKGGLNRESFQKEK